MDQVAFSSEDPMRKAWESWSKTEDFKNAVKWALATTYEDGRRIKNTERIEHIKGAMWRAFLKGIDYVLMDHPRN